MPTHRLLPALLALLLSAGCDTAEVSGDAARAQASEARLTVELGGRARADFYYDLDPVAEGARFDATLVGTRGSLGLRHQGSAYGRGDVMLVAPDRPAASITLEYLNAGALVGTRAFEKDGALYQAGTADREPDSVHYVTYPDGTVEVIYDYDGDEKDDPGTAVTTSDGSRVELTHVRFRIRNADLGTPRTLELASASQFALR